MKVRYKRRSVAGKTSVSGTLEHADAVHLLVPDPFTIRLTNAEGKYVAGATDVLEFKVVG